MAEETKKPVDQAETEPDMEETPEAAEELTENSPEDPAEEAEGTEEETEAENEEKAGRGFNFGFGKNKKEDKKDQQIAELTDKVKRQLAEFENFRKRTEKEKSTMFEMGARDTLEKLLPVVDNLERGLAAIPESERESATAVGMEKIYKQLQKTLEELGVKPIEAVGKEFSPDLHNAVMQSEEEGVGENIIVEEFQKGYFYREAVLRHSMVKVNK